MITFPRVQLLAAALPAGLMLASCHHKVPQVVHLGPTVRVINHSGCRAAVWVARDSAHTRLGRVADGREEELPVPQAFVAGRDSVRFLAFRGDSQCVQVTRLPAAGVTRFVLLLNGAPDSTLAPGAICPCPAGEQRGAKGRAGEFPGSVREPGSGPPP